MSKWPGWLDESLQKPLVIGGRQLPGRIWTASGCFGHGTYGQDILSPDFTSPFQGIGCVVTKTITLSPRLGNPPPRVWDCGTGALNSIGLENPGLEKFIAEIVPELVKNNTPFIASIAGTKPEEFGTMAAALHKAASRFDNWHGIELNLSCPNVAHGGVDFGRNIDTIEACVSAARKAVPDRAVLAKLTPNSASIAPLAQAAANGGADAITAINTLIGMDINLQNGKPVLPRIRGGYSGPALLPVALSKVDEIVQQTGIPVVAVGGASSTEDVLKFFAVGAIAVQIGTAMMRDPFTVSKINRDLFG
jgi:dihydroorotate dehydrogenase (NAD+) catalytic subunit